MAQTSRLNRALITSLTLCFISASAQAQSIATTAPSPVVVTLEDAIHRAQQNEPTFAGARGDQQLVAIDRYLTKTALLPSVVYHNQALYTQPNGQKNQGDRRAISQPRSLLPTTPFASMPAKRQSMKRWGSSSLPMSG